MDLHASVVQQVQSRGSPSPSNRFISYRFLVTVAFFTHLDILFLSFTLSMFRLIISFSIISMPVTNHDPIKLTVASPPADLPG